MFTSEETGVLASISFGSMLLFLSGVILPLESISPALRGIMYFNPFVIAEKLVREVLLFNSSLQAQWLNLVMLFSYALVLFLVILVLESLLHKHFFNNLFHHHHAQRHKDKINK
jgi:ABC-type polysaccharide/polyol phosphate export permease